ncbi:hypothetical protein IFM89_006498 [Coptis chinensis]|uniref:Uncharacterized protein n=1 Tax=Coptis chinensis TaxID=261450 RepID=A0A835IK78_9MAGN|nr:hypothetical protein IFM89_006498 [Coptis chinensis]
MDSYYLPGGSNSLDDDQLNEDMGDDATNILGSSTSAASKKRGPSIGIEEIESQPRYIARRDIPICYDDWQHINKGIKDKVIKTLGRQFVFEYEKTIDTDYTRQKLNEAWRNYKHKLYETFVEDEDPSLVKEVAPRNIPLKDWHKFVDYCNTDKFKNSIKNHISKHPELQYDLFEDAIATVVGPDKRGRYRGLGTGVCKIVLRKGDSLMKKNDDLMEANTLLERRMETMGTFNDNVPSPHSRASHHSIAPLENAYYIGKDCQLRGGWPLELVARGVVQDVDPNTEYGERTLEEGSFKVYVQVVRRPDVILPFPHNPW